MFLILCFQQQLTDDFFYESAEKISFFFEGIILLIILGKASLPFTVFCFSIDKDELEVAIGPTT